MKQNTLTSFVTQTLARLPRLSLLTPMMLGTLGALGPQVHGQDFDGDGFDSSIDCDDSDATVFPGALDIMCNGIDEDCDGADAGPCIPAVETVRVGTPPNPNVFGGAASPPIIGTTWDPFVDHTGGFIPGAAVDFAFLAITSLNIPTTIGTLLCSFPGLQSYTSAPGVPFAFSVPLDIALAGSSVCVQAGSWLPGTFALTNALDLVIGNL